MAKYSQSVTKRNDQVKTTEHGDKTVTKTDGGYQPLTQEQQTDFATNYVDPLRNQYNVNEEGKYNGDVAQLFGFSPDEYIAREQAKQKAAAFKRKEAGWANALKVISDIATTAAGGNVYQTPLANVGREQTEVEEQSRDNVRKMGQAVSQAKRGQEIGFQQAKQKALADYLKLYGVKQNTTTTTQGNTVETTKGGDSKTTYYPSDNNGNSGSGGSGFVMNIRKQNGNIDEYNISSAEAKSVIGLLKDRYTKLLNGTAFGDDPMKDEKISKYEEALKSAGILKSINDDGTYTFNESQLLQSGRYFNLDQGTIDRIIAATGGKVKFITPKGWGNVTNDIENKEYDF